MKIIEVLKSFGLSDYEAKALVALLSKGTLTAKEISEISRIPRTSVYDVMNSLLSKGLVEAFGRPMKFKAMSTEEIISLISRRVSEDIDYLKRELPKIEAEEVDVIRVYRGDIVVEKLREMVTNAKVEILAILSFVPDEIKEILKNAKCKITLISSNAKEIEGAEAYEFKRKKEIMKSFREFCHGLFIFDDERTMVIFMNNIKMGIVSDSDGVIQFSKMLIIPVLNFLKSEVQE
jgi:sugar-specific transcriptional regulator TrmB